MAQLGERVGGGGMSEVFAWGEGRVVKLFLAAYDHMVERERDCARAVGRSGVASPASYEVVEVHGRRGIVYERVEGPTLLDQLVRQERTPGDVGRVLAAVHLAIHTAAVPDLPDLAEALRARGRTVPAGAIVFHGDFHPGNVIAGPDGPRTIDWVNAHRAPRAADVARTVMAVRYQALRPDQAAEALARERAVRTRILDRYLTAYLAQEPIERADLALWLTHAAGALHRQESASADAADLVALAAGRHDDVADGVCAGCWAWPDALMAGPEGPAIRRSSLCGYLMILVTRPEPTVRPPSRMAKSRPSSMAMGEMSSTVISVLSPGMHISTPSGRVMVPVTSVVRK